MKTLLFFLFLATSSSINLFAQQPWAAPGATWYYSNVNGFMGYEGYQKIQKTGDTLINGINCDNLLITDYIYDYTISSFRSDTSRNYTYISNDSVYFVFISLYLSIFLIYFLFTTDFNRR